MSMNKVKREYETLAFRLSKAQSGFIRDLAAYSSMTVSCVIKEALEAAFGQEYKDLDRRESLIPEVISKAIRSSRGEREPGVEMTPEESTEKFPGLMGKES